MLQQFAKGHNYIVGVKTSAGISALRTFKMLAGFCWACSKSISVHSGPSDNIIQVDELNGIGIHVILKPCIIFSSLSSNINDVQSSGDSDYTTMTAIMEIPFWAHFHSHWLHVTRCTCCLIRPSHNDGVLDTIRVHWHILWGVSRAWYWEK